MGMHYYSCSKFRKLREIPSEGFQFLSEVENVPTDGHMGVHKRSKIFLRKTGIENGLGKHMEPCYFVPYDPESV